MKTMLAIGAIAGSTMAASAQGTDLLLAWWSFNNTNNDSDLLNATGDDNGRSSFGHMLDNNNPFNDGYYDATNDLLYPVFDGFGGFDPGELINDAIVDSADAVPLPSNFGAAIDVSGLVGDNFGASTDNNWGSFSGNSANAPDGGSTFGGGSLGITGSGNNGSSFEIVADLTGFSNIEISWANRGTSTGYNSRTVEVSTDGTNFTEIFFDFATLSSSWQIESADAGDLLDGASNAIIRFTVDGATSTNGNNRFDNIVLTGDVIPTPGTVAALGLGGLMAARRRRA
ncbi:MAG: hypothetical protein AAF235_05995 [Planctomycetota bacterium]